MQEGLIYFGALLTIIISIITIARFLFYTKAEINTKFAEAKADSDKRDEVIQEKINHTYNELINSLAELKDKLYANQVESERNLNNHNQEVYEKIATNNSNVERYNQNMMKMIADIHQENKQLAVEFSESINIIKDELKNDYINRCNELLTLINTKVNISDFDRLETKFDRVTETITELKTIVQLQREGKKDK